MAQLTVIRREPWGGMLVAVQPLVKVPVRYSPFLGWRDVELAEAVRRATGLVCTIENDVKSLTLAEQWFGDGVGASSFALVTVGTGIGCGLVVNGGLVRGAHGVAGEIGHIPVDDGGPVCHCGGRGCVEAIASTQAIVTAARAVTGRPRLTIKGAIDGAHAGDPGLRAVFARAGHAIGLGLAAMANLIGPERIIVSGEAWPPTTCSPSRSGRPLRRRRSARPSSAT